MFEKTLRFFIENYKINYVLFFLLVAIGSYSYTKIPKEVSPTIEPDSITIRGGYPGASSDILNTIAVEPIEEQCQSIDGVSSISSVIKPGSFSITLELERKDDKLTVSQDVKDAISLILPDLPSDMDEPLIRGVGHAKSIMQVSIISSKVPREELIKRSHALKNRIMKIKNVSDVTIFGDSDVFYEILINEEKVNAYSLSSREVFNAFLELSNVFPLGNLDNQNEPYFISMGNNKKLAEEIENTLLSVNGAQIALKEIAQVKKRFSDSSTLASMNAQNSITLSISQNEHGDAIEIVDEIKKVLAKLTNKDITYNVRMDHSSVVKDSLNVIISNILFGIIFIALLTAILVNVRIAFIIALGIPTSFVMGAIYFQFTGYSINVNSLIGVLIAIGIIVDDAIVVSENIQQYIEKGFSPKEAAFLGTKEMAKPVTIASITTLFSFIPLLMISGTLGEIIKLIPIAFSALIIASLIESFIFLPIHASHTLSASSRTLSWKRANQIYITLLTQIAKYQKTFLTLFFILTPLGIYMGVKESKFHMFEKYDSKNVNVTFRASPTTTLEESLKIIQTIEGDILKNKEKFFVSSVSSTAGYRRSATGSAEMYPYVGYISLELENQEPTNIFDTYITPWLSPYENTKNKIRNRSSKEISKELRKWLQQQGYKQKFVLDEIQILESGMRHRKADIMIGVVSEDHQKAIQSVKAIEEKLSTFSALKYFGDNIKFGSKEVKLEINSYGESLGITQEQIASYVSNLFRSKKIGSIFDDKELIDIELKSFNFQNDLQSFKNLEIPLKDSSMVKLSDICEFKIVESLEKLVKDDGETTFYVYANIDQSLTTTSDILEKLEPLFKEIKSNGVKLKFKGEREQKRALQTEMVLASVLALVLIFSAILYLFNSIKETLIVMSVIPFSILGVYGGHFVMGLQISLPSLIGVLGLAGVIVNDGIIMMAQLKYATTTSELFELASKRLRPIWLTSITTIVGLSSLIFFSSAEAVMFQPLAISLGYGLFWGTLLNLFYLPILYNFLRRSN